MLVIFLVASCIIRFFFKFITLSRLKTITLFLLKCNINKKSKKVETIELLSSNKLQKFLSSTNPDVLNLIKHTISVSLQM